MPDHSPDQTIARLEVLLAERGYATRRLDATALVVPVKTESYKSLGGLQAAMICLHVNSEDRCLELALPWAFDATGAVQKDAVHHFLFEAMRAVPLVKALLDPNDGEVRLRVALPLGPDGVRDDDVLRGIQLLRTCVERWHQPITAVIESGTLDEPPPTVRQAVSTSERLEGIARRAGGVNRLRVLLQFHRRLESERNTPKEADDGDHGS